MARLARHVRATGRVQGVFFRQSAARQAQALGVAGWVRNCPDGAVEAHVEGDEAAVEAMLGWLRQGPVHARVDRLDIAEATPLGAQGFEIRA